MAADYQYNEDEMKLKINCLGYIYGANIEDYPECMARVVDTVLEVKKVVSITLAKEREYEYDYEQTKMISEIAGVLDFAIKENLVAKAGMIFRKLDWAYPDWNMRLQYILFDLLRKDPVGAYVELLRELRFIKVKMKSATSKDAYAALHRYATGVLDAVKEKLEAAKMIALAKEKIAGYHVGDRTIYRQIFSPMVRPNFMLTRYMIVPPEGGRSVDRYMVGDAQVEIYKMPSIAEYFYHILPPEFKLPDDKYAVLDQARLYMATHQPKTVEFVRSRHIREVFFNIGRDMIRDVAEKSNVHLTSGELEQLANILTRYTAGLGVLEILMNDQRVQDVFVNSPIEHQPILIFHQDFEECRTNLIPTHEDAEAWATRLRIESGRPLDEANPVLDAEINIPGGRARFAVITRSLSPEGLGFAIRRHRDRPWTLPLFIKAGMLDPLAAGLLSFLVDGSVAMLVAGGRGAGKCLEGSELVQMANGEFRDIKSVVEENLARGEISECDDGYHSPTKNLEIMTLDKELKIRPARVSRVWKRRAHPESMKITTSSGKTITCTPEHPFFVPKGLGIGQIRADEIKAGCYIASARKLSINATNRELPSFSQPKKARQIKVPDKITPELMEFLGYVYGDGHIAKPKHSKLVMFTNNNPVLQKRFKDLALHLFGIDNVKKKNDKRNGTTSHFVFSSALVSYLTSIFSIPSGKKADIISLPRSLCSLPNAELASLIRALFDCDSSASKRRKEIEYSTASKKLAFQVQSLLSRFGVVSFLKKKVVKGRPYYRVIIRGDGVEIYMENIGFAHPEKLERARNSIAKSRCNTNIDVVPVDGVVLKELRRKLGIQNGKRLRSQQAIHNMWGIESGAQLATREGLRHIAAVFSERYMELASHDPCISDARSLLRLIKSSHKLASAVDMLEISPSHIASASGISRAGVSSFMKGTCRPHIFMRIMNDLPGIVRKKVSRIESLSCLGPLVQNIPAFINETSLTYASLSSMTSIPETSLKSYAYGGINIPSRRAERIRGVISASMMLQNDAACCAKDAISGILPVDMEKTWNGILSFLNECNALSEEIARHSGLSVGMVEGLRHGSYNPSLASMTKLLEFAVERSEKITRAGDAIEKLKMMAESDIFWDKVVSVEKVKPSEEWVYDLTVDGTHSFVASGLIAHNTSILAALMLELLPKIRVCVIQDTLELPIVQMRDLNYNIESLKSRSVITHVETEMPAEEALRTALRLGDSALILGEVRSSIPGWEEVVVVENGVTKRVPIQQLENREISDYSVPTLGFDMKVGNKPLAGFVKHPPRKKLLEVVTKTGRRVTVTPDHSLFHVTKDFRVAPIECKDLKVGESIVIPASMPVGFNDVDEINVADALPGFRFENFEDDARTAIQKVGWKRATEIAGVTSGDIYNYFRSAPNQQINMPISMFRRLMDGTETDFNVTGKRITRGTGNSIPAAVPVNEDFCRFLGYFVSEGYSMLADGCGGGVILSNTSPALLNDMTMLSKNIFGLIPKSRIIHGAGDCVQLRLGSVPLASFLNKLGCGRICTEKRAPPLIFGLSRPKIASFLRGLYSGDGSFTASKRSGNSIRYFSTSRKLVEDVSYLLQAFGIVGTIRERKVNKGNNLWSVEFKDRDMVETFMREIGFMQSKPPMIIRAWRHTTANSIKLDKDELRKHLPEYPRKYRHLFRFGCCSKSYLKQVANDPECAASERLKTFANGEFFLDEVKEIREIVLDKEVPVYDLSVDPSQNFIGGFGGILLHNTEARALYEAMRIGALSNVVAGTIHGESAYGVYDRVVNDLGVPPTSFKATDIIPICKTLRSADGMHRFRRMTEITEVRKDWETNPLKEGGFVNLMEYSGKLDRMKPTDTLINGESDVLNRIASYVKEWSGDWSAVWDNINLRAKIKQTMVDMADKLKKPEILEAEWVTLSNSRYHLIVEQLRKETGAAEPKEVYEQWAQWMKSAIKNV